MTRHVPISEFKDHASALVAAAERGEEIVITRHGKPVAALRSTGGGMDEREQRARAALSNLDELRAVATSRGQKATQAEWSDWKHEGQR